jgi:hypothetical protein
METIYSHQKPMLSAYVAPKHSLQRNQKQLRLIKEICIHLQGLEDRMTLTKDMELLLYICNQIENVVFKKDKINKKEMVITIYKSIFGDASIDLDFLERGIEYLIDNKKIRKLSVLKKYVYPFGSYVFKKL